jgi:type IV pilus assembly protein PilO
VLGRVLAEHRRFIVVLAVALAANVGVYAGLIYPLAARVADADNRAERAARALRDARREFDAAKAVATSRGRAEAELYTFYHDVLPADLDAAHRLTYLDLAQRARQNNLRVTRRTASEDLKRGSGFGRLNIAFVLEGQYEDIRRFIYGIETAPGFLVIDDMAISQGRDAQRSLVLTLQLSTYYRVANDAS